MNEKHIAMAKDAGFDVDSTIGFCGYIVEEELEAYTNLVIADAVKERDERIKRLEDALIEIRNKSGLNGAYSEYFQIAALALCDPTTFKQALGE